MRPKQYSGIGLDPAETEAVLKKPIASEESLHRILHGDKLRRASRRFAVAHRSRLFFHRFF
jgi:hypothetical protein